MIYRYSSLDNEAPQVRSSTSTSLYNFYQVFKACFVTGYGSKNPVGWTLDSEDINNRYAVFISNSSVLFKLKISDGGAYNNLCLFELYRGITSTLVNDLNNSAILKSYAVNENITRPWSIITDGNWVFISISYTTNVLNKSTVYLGKYISYLPQSKCEFPICIMGNCNNASTSTNASYRYSENISTMGNTTFQYLYTANGCIDTGVYSANCPVVRSWWYTSTVSNTESNIYFDKIPCDVNKLPIERIYIYNVGQCVLGYLPMIWVPGIKINNKFEETVYFNVILNSVSRTLECFNFLSTSMFFIETSDTWYL